ncbi:MAG: hypothetical protein BWZ07_02890 [Alphaproteobacteria bacterium ADurb.BinA280]|nr:MAG: hypothetical protein BWZ07_02890 [Alphaproteobacteria bacterium ADurb.BinA280]
MREQARSVEVMTLRTVDIARHHRTQCLQTIPAAAVLCKPPSRQNHPRRAIHGVVERLGVRGYTVGNTSVIGILWITSSLSRHKRVDHLLGGIELATGQQRARQGDERVAPPVITKPG